MEGVTGKQLPKKYRFENKINRKGLVYGGISEAITTTKNYIETKYWYDYFQDFYCYAVVHVIQPYQYYYLVFIGFKCAIKHISSGIQRCSVWILEKYYCDFPVYNSALVRTPFKKLKDEVVEQP